VPFEDSDKLTERAKTLGVPTTYWKLEGLGREFDLGFPDLESVEIEVSDAEFSVWKYMKELLQGLDEVVGK
jgi:hypothetical protein